MSDPRSGTPLPPLSLPVKALLAVVLVEALVMLAVAVLLVVDILTMPALSIASSIALVVLALIATATLLGVFVGILRGQPWTRAITMVWQVLQAAVAVVILQGDMADALGWGLAAISLLGLVLVFHPKVTERLRHRG